MHKVDGGSSAAQAAAEAAKRAAAEAAKAAAKAAAEAAAKEAAKAGKDLGQLGAAAAKIGKDLGEIAGGKMPSKLDLGKIFDKSPIKELPGLKGLGEKLKDLVAKHGDTIKIDPHKCRCHLPPGMQPLPGGLTKRHPEGGSIGLGGSPVIGGVSVRRSGSDDGIAASNARVYGCAG